MPMCLPAPPLSMWCVHGPCCAVEKNRSISIGAVKGKQYFAFAWGPVINKTSWTLAFLADSVHEEFLTRFTVYLPQLPRLKERHLALFYHNQTQLHITHVLTSQPPTNTTMLCASYQYNPPCIALTDAQAGKSKAWNNYIRDHNPWVLDCRGLTRRMYGRNTTLILYKFKRLKNVFYRWIMIQEISTILQNITLFTPNYFHQ